MFGLGPTEMVIIAVVVALIFGVGRLPELGGAVGKSIREFKRNVEDEPEQPKTATAAAPAQRALPVGPETRAGEVRREEV